MTEMAFEIVRLMMGLMMAYFHQRIADFILEHERVLIVAFRQRGIPVPILSRQMAYNIYFSLGIFVVALELFRIWMLLHP
ncbi:MAG TPA: hypothetical protein VKW78_21565 [Terriglobales bacterium]|nr:hypothetical protein [Terriglobales bacterium]